MLVTFASVAALLLASPNGAYPLILLTAATWMLALSSFLHESAHCLILATSIDVTTLHIEALLWRTSVSPEGSCTRGRLAASAIAGPLTGAAACLCMLPVLPGNLVALITAPHILALAPFSGDGRALFYALKPKRDP